jgi:hypothetical protein
LFVHHSWIGLSNLGRRGKARVELEALGP